MSDDLIYRSENEMESDCNNGLFEIEFCLINGKTLSLFLVYQQARKASATVLDGFQG